MTKRVIIKIFPDGKIQAEIDGIKGKRCTDYMKILEDLLKAEIVDSDYTVEYYEQYLNLEQENREEVKRIN